jgi:DNA-binding response OmpR family regulator
MGVKTILVVEDDVSILRGLLDNLKIEGYNVLSATNGKLGLNMALEELPDMIILDIMLPGLNGYDICRKVKAKKPEMPIIMLTARGKEVDKIAGLDLGADDYVTKPFSLPELMARIRAVFRRYNKTQMSPDRYTFGNVVIDFKKYKAFVSEEEINLCSREFAIIKYLVEHAEEVVNRYDLLEEVWGYESVPTTRTVDNYILNLRKKFEEKPSNPKHIISVRGAGYKFVP